MAKTFAVIGLGIFGRTVCEVLSLKGGDVIAIDNSSDQINKVKDYVEQAILLDSTDEDSLKNAPFDQVDAAIVAIGDNIESSILTTTLLKQLGVPHIIARAVNKTHYQVLKQVGADEIINIEEDQGKRVARNLIAPNILEKVRLSGKITLAEIYAPPFFHERKISVAEIREKYGVNLTGIRRKATKLDKDGNVLRDESFLLPDEAEKITDRDVLILIGEESLIDKLNELEAE